jgi:hypothetical protein
VPIAIYDNGEGLAEPVAHKLVALGYSRVHLLDGGLQGWYESGGELFRDVNVPSRAFGELVEHELHTPSLPAGQVKALIDRGADLVVLDAKIFLTCALANKARRKGCRTFFIRSPKFYYEQAVSRGDGCDVKMISKLAGT